MRKVVAPGETIVLSLLSDLLPSPGEIFLNLLFVIPWLESPLGPYTRALSGLFLRSKVDYISGCPDYCPIVRMLVLMFADCILCF